MSSRWEIEIHPAHAKAAALPIPTERVPIPTERVLHFQNEVKGWTAEKNTLTTDVFDNLQNRFDMESAFRDSPLTETINQLLASLLRE